MTNKKINPVIFIAEKLFEKRYSNFWIFLQGFFLLSVSLFLPSWHTIGINGVFMAVLGFVLFITDSVIGLCAHFYKNK